ncbi:MULTISPECIES: ribonuclease P protein component [unclassified Sedimentibacter]|uniref:ribonuclease P protein component n=1 Tax=unclassified Sedimentibacter TaxID=2649220 RepID=UPI0027DF1535|nr:ribonuclease P protein component [Sedimentibacter sp. MB35-C1]WMJ77989.1 ribonuclease P protein component [Sedimentibacter sp. MB35-C1]
MIIIKKNTEYKTVYNCNNSISDYNLVLFVKKNSFGISRFGFTAAKKIKKAVSRNFIRRRLKEIVRLNEQTIKQGYDIVIMARVNAVESDYRSLEKSFNKLMKRKNLLKGDLNK